MLDWPVTLKGAPGKVEDNFVEPELQLVAHNESVFGTYVVLNNFSNW